MPYTYDTTRPYTYGNPRRNFHASILLTAKPDYYGFATSARPSAVEAAAMRRGRDDYNLYSATGSGSSRYHSTYGMRTGVKPTPPRSEYVMERLYADKEEGSMTSRHFVPDVTQSSWAARAQERHHNNRLRAASADRATSADYSTSRDSWHPAQNVSVSDRVSERATSIERTTDRFRTVQEIRPSRWNPSSHIFSEPTTLIAMPAGFTEKMFDRSSSLGRRMSPTPTISSRRTFY